MKKILLLILICFSANGFAVNWKRVVVDRSGDSYYVDVENIKKINGLLYYSRLEDYLEPRNGDYSFIRKFKVDCTEGKRTWLSDTFFNRPMGKGKITGEINPNKISYPKPSSIGYVVMKFACDYIN
ncbi:MAG: hypothetical protein CBC42_04460 [Betaproteobacteria bacterium TMED82]|nr:MAG: hypothetical protein CBC42_04460 [Betaproteobacteria bacterium TMED82]|tara:strand:+ start:3022 stop:3399 length:378 start_codon:yes stop_codon:yes gene_type:complete